MVGHIAVGDCNREEKLCSARGSNEGMQEIKKKIMKKCEYGELSEALFLWLTQQTDRHCTFRNGRKGHVFIGSLMKGNPTSQLIHAG